MEIAGKEEAKLAIEENNLNENRVPQITVEAQEHGPKGLTRVTTMIFLV